MFESPPTALSVQSPALPSLEQCSDETLILSLGFYTKAFTDNTYQILTGFLLLARQPSCFLARQQVSSAALRQAAPRASDASSAGRRAQAQPPFCEPCSKSS